MSEANNKSRETVEHLCMNCEYFDGGGLKMVLAARAGGDVVHGDCLNSGGPSFETTSADSCSFFYPDSGTWPSDDDATWA